MNLKKNNKKKNNKTKHKEGENAKLSQGYSVGRMAMGYFQSQNYTEEQLSGTLQRLSQRGSARAPTSSLQGEATHFIYLIITPHKPWFSWAEDRFPALSCQ